MEFAEHHFQLHKPKKGGTLIEQLKQVERQTGRKPPELVGPEFPTLMGGVWSAFVALSRSRTAGGFSANPITFEAIKAFCELTHTPLSPREVEVIQELDQVYREIMNQDG